jgi:hypothetical protein
VVHTERRAAWDAKNRFGLPLELPLDWAGVLRRRARQQRRGGGGRRARRDRARLPLVPDAAKREAVEKWLAEAGSSVALLRAGLNKVNALIPTTSEKEHDPMSIDIAEGYYDRQAHLLGLTSSKNGHDQFAIEVAIEVPDTSAEDGKRVVHMTKFGGLENDESLGYTARDAETCGCDVTKDIREWTVDTGRAVRVHVVDNGEYGMKLKSIFPPTRPAACS